MLMRVLLRSCARRDAPALVWFCTLMAAACAGPPSAPEPADAALKVLFDQQRSAASEADPAPRDEPGDLAGAREVATATPEGRLERAARLLAGEDPPAGERLLREELASGGRSTEAALVLVELCTAREEFDGALAVVEAALARAPGAPLLTLTKARLLFDLAQPIAAADLLAPLAVQPDVHPRVLFELAQAERARLRFDAALTQLGVLLGRLSTHEWVKQHEVALVELRLEVEAERAAGRRRSVEARELLAVLRAAASTQDRLRAFRQLVQESGDLCDLALRIAAADREPLLRQEALRRRCFDGTVAVAWIRGGLDDPAGTVRGTAASLAAAQLSPAEAVPLLLHTLDRETDHYAFDRLHDALCKLHGERVSLPAGELDEEQRRDVRRQWRQRWQR